MPPIVPCPAGFAMGNLLQRAFPDATDSFSCLSHTPLGSTGIGVEWILMLTWLIPFPIGHQTP